MNDHQLLRYSRHILLDELGIEGQQMLLASHHHDTGRGYTGRERIDRWSGIHGPLPACERRLGASGLSVPHEDPTPRQPERFPHAAHPV